MKRVVLVVLLAALGFGQAVAQGAPSAGGGAPIRIRIRHADPWAVKALLEGLPLRSPEMSTLPGFQGLGQAASGGINQFLKEGFLVVNPTDNSLWYYPRRG